MRRHDVERQGDTAAITCSLTQGPVTVASMSAQAARVLAIKLLTVAEAIDNVPMSHRLPQIPAVSERRRDAQDTGPSPMYHEARDSHG